MNTYQVVMSSKEIVAQRNDESQSWHRSSTGPREGPEEEEEALAEDAGGASRIGEGEGIVVEEAGDEVE
ncbi:hypothetical protein Taro_048541 [Colocasia esculenta]|uniref:Uncharacterized protein n=1 Tax=Colocasia esculenta TaxID=4460 RepID=A0A843X8E2_COLES|nr:hypothetical protein [Colocasia esculenta]